MRYYVINKVILFILFFEIGAILTPLLDAYLDAFMQFFAVMLVVGIDMALGMIRGFKEHKFETNKALKGVYRLVAFWVVLAVVISIEHGFNYIDWLSEAVMLPLIIFTLISILKNLQLLGAIPNNVLTDIINRIDKYKEPQEVDGQNNN